MSAANVVSDEHLADMRAATALDRAIAARLTRKEQNLAEDYLAIGRSLAEMQLSKGFKLVGYLTFESYLKAKPTFGRTYYSYLIKLGRARDLDRQLPVGIGGSHLVEYARATDLPDMIGTLITATWDEVSQLSVRHLAKVVNAYARENADVYRKPGRGHGVKRRPAIVVRVLKVLERLGAEERLQMIEALEAVMEPYRAKEGN